MSVEEIVPFVRGSGYDLTGVKEVCQFPKYLGDYAVEEADVILVTMRDPVETYASMRAVLQFSVAECITIFAGFVYWMEKVSKPVILVPYDELCADPLACLNARCKDFFTVEGPVYKNPMAGFGDGRALNSRSIERSQSRSHLVSDGERAAVMAVVGELFEGVRPES